MRNAAGDIVLDDSMADAEDDAAFTPERMEERRRKMAVRNVATRKHQKDATRPKRGRGRLTPTAVNQ